MLGREGMGETTYAQFVNFKETGALLAPSVPANKIAYLALHAPMEWSGEFINVTSEQLPETW